MSDTKSNLNETKKKVGSMKEGQVKQDILKDIGDKTAGKSVSK